MRSATSNLEYGAGLAFSVAVGNGLVQPFRLHPAESTSIRDNERDATACEKMNQWTLERDLSL